MCNEIMNFITENNLTISETVKKMLKTGRLSLIEISECTGRSLLEIYEIANEIDNFTLLFPYVKNQLIKKISSEQGICENKAKETLEDTLMYTNLIDPLSELWKKDISYLYQEYIEDALFFFGCK